MTSGGLILWNAFAFCENVQDLWADGKTTYERRFGELFISPVIAFGALAEYHPISAKDRSRLHPVGKKV